jgi:hypothetical protein
MSNTDFSQTTRVVQKSAQTQFAGFVQAAGDAITTPGLVRMGGGATASTAILTNSGATVAGATKVGTAAPLAATSASVTTYSLAKTILARR